MATLTDYFTSIAYKPKYFLGDRVFGYYNKIPFIGSVGNDRIVGNEGPTITIHLDLPLVIDKKLRHVIIVKHKDIKRLVNFDVDETKSKRTKKG